MGSSFSISSLGGGGRETSGRDGGMGVWEEHWMAPMIIIIEESWKI